MLIGSMWPHVLKMHFYSMVPRRFIVQFQKKSASYEQHIQKSIHPSINQIQERCIKDSRQRDSFDARTQLNTQAHTYKERMDVMKLTGIDRDTRIIIIFSILLTHEGSHREAYRDFQPSLTSSAGGAKGFSDHRFRAPPAYTTQLLTLHQHRANNQYRTTNQIQPTLRVSSSTQATLEQLPIQVLTELNVP